MAQLWRSSTTALALLSVGVLFAGCTSAHVDAWHGRDLDATDPPWNSQAVAPGETFEIDYHGITTGEVLSWDWFVDEQDTIQFDVHTHRGASALTLQRAFAVEDTGHLEIDSDGTYSMTWSNVHGSSLDVWFRVPQGYTTAS